MKCLLTSRADIEFFGRTTEKEDIAPVDYENLSFTVKKTDFIYRLIKMSKVFAVNIPRMLFDKESDLCEMNEGAFTDKFKLTGLKRLECSSIDCPCIGKSVVYECGLLKEKEEGDKVTVSCRVLMKRDT